MTAYQKWPAASTKAREAEGEEAGSSDTVAGAAKDGTHTMARRYLEACRADYSAAAVKHAVSLGSELLKLAGSVEKAARALNQERVVLLGNHLAFTEEGHVLGVSDLHRAYLIEMAQHGVPSRREAASARESAKNHGSVRGHEEELLQKAWLGKMPRMEPL